MYTIELGKSGLQVPTVAVGCMRISNLTEHGVSEFVDTALSFGANFFDHADIYSGGKYILDALQESEILQGDGQKYVDRLRYGHHTDPAHPRIEVEIVEPD